jgi:hypothetical protein
MSAEAVRREVDVGAIGPARVEPPVELRVDDQTHERLAKLGYR